MDYKDRIQTALNVAVAYVPRLAGLAALADVRVSSQIETAGVFPSGRMLISETFAEKLSVKELAFIVAHELSHLFLRTHERLGKRTEDAELLNIAHDFIINATLKQDFGWYDDVPGGGLDWERYRWNFDERFPGKTWKPATEYSLEELATLLRPVRDEIQNVWDKEAVASRKRETEIREVGGGRSSTFGDLLAAAGIKAEDFAETSDGEGEADETQTSDDGGETGETPLDEAGMKALNSGVDALSEALERQMFPDENPVEIARKIAEVEETVVRSYSEQALVSALDGIQQAARGRGTGAGSGASAYSLLRGTYQTPWEAALQRWFDSVAPPRRSWARPSRRGGDRTDVVLPGKNREGWTLNIVLDTSGSMTGAISQALGAIDQFCQANDVESVRILQCDTQVTSDEYVEVGSLERFEAKGFGGSDMSPAMLKLAEEPDVEAVIVLTDGGICYPQGPMPYETLWCIAGGYWTPQFSYGTVVCIDSNGQN